MKTTGDSNNVVSNGYLKWEELPIPVIGDGERFCETLVAKYFWDNRELSDLQKDEVKWAINEFSGRLLLLPRVTREFLAMLYERSEEINVRFPDSRSAYLLAVLKTYPSAQEEIDLLSASRLITIDSDDKSVGDNSLQEIGMQMYGFTSPLLSEYFYYYVKDHGLSFRKIIGEINLSEF